MKEYSIIHKTQYQYSEEVTHCINQLYMRPSSSSFQECLHHSVSVIPQVDRITERIDYFGNLVQQFSVDTPHRELEVISEAKVRVPERQMDTDFDMAWDEIPKRISNSSEWEEKSKLEFVLGSPMIPLSLHAFDLTREIFLPGRSVKQCLLDLAKKIRYEFEYDPQATTLLTPLEEVLEIRKGVCQDFAHLCIAALRIIGLPSRYVSGYIETTPPPGKPKLQGSDATHAWFGVFLPGFGWYDVDPTNGRTIGEDYIYTAFGRDYTDVSPMKGIIFGGGKHKLKVAVDVIPKS